VTAGRWVLVRPPVAGGVRDFSDILAAGLREYGASDVQLIELTEQKPALQLCSGDIIVLQYSGYGYARRGAPLWLPNHLQEWRRSNVKVGVWFHELYATGPPWRSSFWLTLAQRYVARRIAALSDFWLTNREGSARWLERFAGARPHAVLPVFSNLGEPQCYQGNRSPRLTVCGSGQLRLATYRRALQKIVSWARRQNLELHDIGPDVPDPKIVARLRQAGFVIHGQLPARDVSDLLATASFGILAYPVEFVAKSTIFAAYCAHGLCPLLLSKGSAPTDGLAAGTHYIAGIPRGVVNMRDAEAIAMSAWAWYQPHRVMSHVETLEHCRGDAIGESVPPGAPIQ
jgi:hypothetical protein